MSKPNVSDVSREAARAGLLRRHAASSCSIPARMAWGRYVGAGLGLYVKQTQALPALGAASPRARWRKRFSRGLHPLRHVRPRLPLRHAESCRNRKRPWRRERPTSPRVAYRARCATTFPASKACPTGALDHKLTDINKAKWVSPFWSIRNLPQFPGPALRCLLSRLPGDRQGNHAGTRTQSAYRPAHDVPADGAFRTLYRLRQVRKSCVTEEASIKVYPLRLPRARSGKHYQLGWEEQKKHGGSLIDEKSMIDLPDRVPEGVKLPGHYDPASGMTAPPGMPGSTAGPVPSAPPGFGGPAVPSAPLACPAPLPGPCPAIPRPGRWQMSAMTNATSGSASAPTRWRKRLVRDLEVADPAPRFSSSPSCPVPAWPAL